MVDTPSPQIAQILCWLENVCDPEVPVLTILDLGVVREVLFENPDTVVVRITPTYTGCPAMSMIAANIRLELLSRGIKEVKIEEILSPAWTSDWMTESGKEKLRAYGIAPPMQKARLDKMLFSDVPVPCPQCGSEHTERLAEFGSTACKSLHRCLDCKEPFDYFKCH